MTEEKFPINEEHRMRRARWWGGMCDGLRVCAYVWGQLATLSPSCDSLISSSSWGL